MVRVLWLLCDLGTIPSSTPCEARVSWFSGVRGFSGNSGLPVIFILFDKIYIDVYCNALGRPLELGQELLKLMSII